MTDDAFPDFEDAAPLAPEPEDDDEEQKPRALRWPRPWTREFWTVDIVYAALGVGLAIVSTILIAYLSAGYDRQVQTQAREQRHLNAVFRAGGRALFEMAAASALERTFETHLESVAGDTQRRAETAGALVLSLRSFKTYLSILAPDAVAPFTAQSDAWLKEFAAGNDAVPATIRASIVRYINGPVSDGNMARAARRAALKQEIAATREARDFWRATGAFFQVFGIILAICGQVAGRRARARQFAPPDLKRRLSTGPFSRHFWTLDVVAVTFGSLISLGGTIALYFIVVSYYHGIDEIRGRLEERGMQVELTEAANHAYDDMGMLELWVGDLVTRRPADSYTPPAVTFPKLPGEDSAPSEVPPAAYVRSRRSFPVFWLARVSEDNDPARFEPLIEEYYRVYEDLDGAPYAAYVERIRAAAGAKLVAIREERVTLATELNALEIDQAFVRDAGGLMQLFGLLFAFTGYLAYYKRPRV
ncbi:hypothetical protein sos41_05980 [Alphaproteobacteria bacterium SO-S41]|nr:hypothetical protein sos41_05980 [Alphaproteobacteria bacterium SO-S41]